MAERPTPGPNDVWGQELNDHLDVSLNTDGTLRAGLGGSSALSAASIVGATQIVLTNVPESVVVGTLLAIDAWTTQCELRSVSSIAGTTVTLDSALKFAHVANDAIAVVSDFGVPTTLYGLTGDGSNEWAPLQRMFRESTAYGGLAVWGGGGTYSFQQPLMMPTGSRINRLQIETRTGFSPVELSSYAIHGAHHDFFFTAIASTNTFTSVAIHGVSVSHQVVLSAPWGETFPGGVTAGRVYGVRTIPTSTTFTIGNHTLAAGANALDSTTINVADASAFPSSGSLIILGTTITYTGKTATSFTGCSAHPAYSGDEAVVGPEIDITSDGAGWGASINTDLYRVYWESLRVDLTVADLNGVNLTWLQQPGWTRNLRVEMDAAATSQGAAIGAKLGAQLAYHDNLEINPSVNCTGASVGGTGIIIKGFNCNGAQTGCTGMVVTGRCQTVRDIWTEQCGRAGIELLGDARGIDLGGTWLQSTATPTTSPALLVSTTTTSYTVNQIRPTPSSQLILSDTARGISLVSADVEDGGKVFHGLRQPYGTAGPLLNARTSVHTSADYTVTRVNEYVRVNSTSAARVITVPTAVGWTGWTTTIFNAVGANTVTIDPAGSETVGGAATLVLAAGEAATLYSDGANYQIIGRN